MDDILDYTGYEKRTGKRRGQDLLEGKITLPLIYVLGKRGVRERRDLVRILKQGKSAENVERIIEMVIREGGIEYTADQARGFVERAISCLDVLPPSKNRKALVSLTRYIVERSW